MELSSNRAQQAPQIKKLPIYAMLMPTYWHADCIIMQETCLLILVATAFIGYRLLTCATYDYFMQYLCLNWQNWAGLARKIHKARGVHGVCQFIAISSSRRIGVELMHTFANIIQNLSLIMIIICFNMACSLQYLSTTKQLIA